jgi:hypothetical protein
MHLNINVEHPSFIILLNEICISVILGILCYILIIDFQIIDMYSILCFVIEGVKTWKC